MPPTSSPSMLRLRASAMADSKTPRRFGIFAPDVDPALFGTHRVPADGHGFDQRERVVLHEHPILERSGLGLVGVDHEMAGSVFVGHGRPLEAGRERRSATSGQARVADVGDHLGRRHRHRFRQRVVSAGCDVAVVVLDGRIVDPAKQGEFFGRLRNRRNGRIIAPSSASMTVAFVAERTLTWALPVRCTNTPGACSHSPRQGLPCTLRPSDRSSSISPLRRRCDRRCRRRRGRCRGPRCFEGEQLVEARHAEHLCRRNLKRRGDLVDRPLAEPSDRVAHVVQHGQQEMPSVEDAFRPLRAIRSPSKVSAGRSSRT